MAETSVPITPGTGRNIDTYTVVDGKEQQAVTIGDGQNNNRTAAVEPSGALNTFTGYATLFYDTFVGPLDTTDKWTVTGGAPTVATGTLTLPATASTYNTLRTKDTIRANAGFHYVANGIQLEATAAVGAGRFWGLGTNATTPAAAVLCQDAVGFEVNQADGALLAVTYTAGVRTTVATLTRPTDGAIHRYALVFRVTQAYWYIDNLQVAVAAATFPNVTVPELPALMVRQNAAAFTGTPVFNNTAHLTAESSRQGVIGQDSVIGTRQWRIKAPSTAVAATDSALAVGLHPTSPLPAGTNSIGTTQPPAITKGTQGTVGVTTQDLKDAGRALVSYYMVLPVLTTATDTLQSLTGTKGNATVAATTTPALVTAGKTFRIQAVVASYVSTTTTGYAIVRLRYNTAGLVAIGSPVVAQLTAGSGSPATANAVDTVDMVIPDGFEVPAGTGIGISAVGMAAATATAVGYISVTVTGYEY